MYTGLQAMLDPAPAAAAAVAAARGAGIAVKMITGDHAATATAVAAPLGLLNGRHEGDVLTGADLAALPRIGTRTRCSAPRCSPGSRWSRSSA